MTIACDKCISWGKLICECKKPVWRCALTDKPSPELPVIARVHGIDQPVVLELRWETCNPMLESYFEDYLYWDDPNNDGQDFEDRVFLWCKIPTLDA